jgi:hypothetical protein
MRGTWPQEKIDKHFDDIRHSPDYKPSKYATVWWDKSDVDMYPLSWLDASIIYIFGPMAVLLSIALIGLLQPIYTFLYNCWRVVCGRPLDTGEMLHESEII